MGPDSCCAVCAGCINRFQIGSSSEKAQRVRDKVLKREYNSESDDGNVDEDELSYTLSRSYDTQVLEGHDITWTTERLLVTNDT